MRLAKLRKAFKLNQDQVVEFLQSTDPIALQLKSTLEELHREQINREVTRTLRVVAGWDDIANIPDYRRRILQLATMRDPDQANTRDVRPRQSTIRIGTSGAPSSE